MVDYNSMPLLDQYSSSNSSREATMSRRRRPCRDSLDVSMREEHHASFNASLPSCLMSNLSNSSRHSIKTDSLLPLSVHSSSNNDSLLGNLNLYNDGDEKDKVKSVSITDMKYYHDTDDDDIDDDMDGVSFGKPYELRKTKWRYQRIKKRLLYSTGLAVLFAMFVLVMYRYDKLDGYIKHGTDYTSALLKRYMPTSSLPVIDSALGKTHEQKLEKLLSQQEVIIKLLTNGDKHTLDTSGEIASHLESLRDDIKLQKSLLEEEHRHRTEAEEEVREAWGTFQLSLAEMHGMERIHQADLNRLFQTLIVQHYGDGPSYYVQFEVSKLDSGVDYSHSSYFVVELAPILDMPATVLTFLEQVKHGFWDDTAFYQNNVDYIMSHVVSHNMDRTKDMESHGLAHSPFVEKSNFCKHEQYTLGYKGSSRNDFGPKFFINKKDNTAKHESFPCFGKVIVGTNIVDTMTKLPTTSAPQYLLAQSVHIVKATIVQRVEGEVGQLVFYDGQHYRIYDNNDNDGEI